MWGGKIKNSFISVFSYSLSYDSVYMSQFYTKR